MRFPAGVCVVLMIRQDRGKEKEGRCWCNMKRRVVSPTEGSRGISDRNYRRLEESVVMVTNY